MGLTIEDEKRLEEWKEKRLEERLWSARLIPLSELKRNRWKRNNKRIRLRKT